MAMQRVEWSSSCVDCFDQEHLGDCCCAFFCPCFSYAENAEKLGDSYWGSCIIWYLLATIGCQCVVAGPTRGKIRDKYNLAESPCNDCFLHWCCSACAICQETRELKYQEKAKIAPSPPGVYSPPGAQKFAS